MDPLTRRLLSRPRSEPLVLMYHGIADAGEQVSRWRVSRQAFAEQMRLLRDSGHYTLRLSELERPPAPGGVCITFDDGYRDTFDAARLLADLGFSAAWFLVSDRVGGQADWDKPGQGAALLGLDELRAMAEAGMEFGSHSATHPRLTDLDEASLARELERSRRHLGECLDRNVEAIAYPYGRFDDRVVAAAGRAGYRLGFTTAAGTANAAADPLRIRRITIEGTDDLGRFARKIALAGNDGSWRRLLRYALQRTGLAS